MEDKIKIICDKKWLNRYKEKYNFEWNNIVTIDNKSHNFSYIVLNEIQNAENKTIILISPKFWEHPSYINLLVENTKLGNFSIYSKNLDSYDFTKINIDCVVCFQSNSVKKDVPQRNFNEFLSLQKYLISHFINSKKLGPLIIDKNKNINLLEINEDKITKSIKKRNKKTKKLNNNDYKKTKFSDESSDKPIYQINEKPKILILTDVKGWAWWIKSGYLKKHLNYFYDIDIKSIIDDRSKIDYEKYDLYFTYGYSYINKILRVPFKRRMSGMTAHRPIDMLRKKFNRVAWCHANSLMLYNDLKKIHSNCFYIPNGVDSDLFYPKTEILQNDNITFGHIGKLSLKKGQKEFLEPAVQKINVKYFSHYNNYKTRVEHKNMVDVHQNYDVFLCASEEDGTPCPALESAACGRPIISNKIGNMPELIENYKTGILLEKRDVDLYADAIKWCQNNPEKVKIMGQNIRKKIEEEWTWELMARNYLYMFDNILGIERDLSTYINPAQFHIKD